MEKATKKVNKKISSPKEGVSLNVNIYNFDGKISKSINLPEEIFGAKWNADLVAQVVDSQSSNRRAGTAHTKDRGEVSGTNKKPWQQKGTGRARHGSTRSPLWRHGGVTFGPRNDKSFKKTIPKMMKTKALFSLLSAKLNNGKIIFVENINLNSSKTKDGDKLIKGLTKIDGFSTLCHKKKNNIYLTSPKLDENVKRSFRNLPYMTVHNMEDLNPLDIANSRYLVITDAEKAVSYLSSKLTKKAVK
jgi:large subunit ribosomal protein L4